MTQIVDAARAQGDLLPVLNPRAAKEAYQAYLELCAAILVPYDKRIVKDGVVVQESDYARIPQRKQVDGKWITEYVDAPKKSAWRKLGRFYGVSTEILEKTKEVHPEGGYTWTYTVKAMAGGVTQDAEGSCTSTEKGGKSEHDTRATAHTRAKSRAISDLIGFGQVSAEEYDEYEEKPKPVEATAKVLDPKPVKKPAEQEPLRMGDEERRVAAVLEANGLSLVPVTLRLKGGKVYVEASPTFPRERFGEYDRILKTLKATWAALENRWEVPAA